MKHHRERLSTGVPGLDDLLDGGLLPRLSYLVRGGPGTGKTLLGLQYLCAGVAAGEQDLLITLSLPRDKLCELSPVPSGSERGVRPSWT